MNLQQQTIQSMSFLQLQHAPSPVVGGITGTKGHQRFHRANSRIRLQGCQEITVHECAKIAKY